MCHTFTQPIFRLAFALATAAALAGCLSTRDVVPGRDRRLARLARAHLASATLADAQVGLMVACRETGRTRCAIAADKQMTPASTVKLLTAAACLLAFSPEYRFETRLIPTGERVDGVLNGDLVVVSTGDPTLRDAFADPAAAFASWAARLRATGLQRVRGDLVGVDLPPGLQRYGAGWALDDVPWRYAAPVSRLQLQGNAVRLDLLPADRPEATPGCRVSPTTAASHVACDLRSADKERIVVDWRPLSSGIAVSAHLPVAGETRTRFVSSPDPAGIYLADLHRILGEEGIVVEGSPRVVWTPPAAPGPPLLVHQSPPLREILAVMLKQSDNLIAETLVRALGEMATGDFSFAAGRGAVRATLLPLGVDLARLRYADGSGLSRYNHASAEQIVALLLAMSRGGRRLAAIWRDALPVASHEGTLARRFADTPLAGNLRAKTGSMSSIRCLSGYFAGASGGTYAFSILVNGHLASGEDVDRAIENMLVDFHRHL